MFEGLMRFLGVSPDEKKMYVNSFTNDEGETGYFILRADGSPYAGPYKREKDAKGQLTRLQKTYTPASRRPNKEA